MVEADPAIARLETDVLRDAGYGAESVADAQAAREKARAVPYAGIVFDLAVPGSQGFATAEEVGQLEANRHTPVIVVGSDEPEGRKRAFDAGAVAFISKPFGAEAFRSVIFSVIGPAGPRPIGAARAPALQPASRPSPLRIPLSPPAAVTPPPVVTQPEDRRAVPAGDAIAVSFQGGQPYWCEPDGEGLWRCGRCETGTLASPAVGSRCSVCQAEVVELVESSRAGLGWVIVLVLLAVGAFVGWMFIGRPS